MFHQKTFIGVVLSMALLAGLASAGTIKDEVVFNPAEFSMEQRSGFDVVRLADSAPLGQVGAPSVPYRQVNIVLPRGAQAQSLRILAVDSIPVRGKFDLMPVAKPIPLSSEPLDEPFQRDPVVFTANQNFPGIHGKLINHFDLVGQDFVTLQIYPVQYNPVTRKLRLATRIAFEVVYKEGVRATGRTYNFSNKVRDRFNAKLRTLAHNAEDLPEIPINRAPASFTALTPDNVEYVIITNAGLVSSFQPLADWRTERGIPAQIVTTAWIYANYAGAENDDKIRAFVIDANATWGTIYFLLGGDTVYVPPNYKTINGDSIPNDTFYGDFDGDWAYEVYVGRACVDSTAETTTFVNKVLTYEKTPPANYGDKVFFMGFDLDSQTKGEGTKNGIKSAYLPGNIIFEREYDSESGGHETDVKNYLNQGQNLVNHVDHGENNYVGVGINNHYAKLNRSEAGNFTNGTRYCNFYSIACWAGNYADWCFGEALVGDDQGGITYVGNSRYGWYSQGSVTSLSMKYDQEWWEGLFVYNDYIAGETMAESMNRYYPMGATLQYVFTELNLLGDPALHLWTQNPTPLTVTHEGTLDQGNQQFTVEVKDGASPLAGALVCLMKGDEVYDYLATDASGIVRFVIDPATAGAMTVTVTAQNYQYYQGTAMVSASKIALELDAFTIPESGGTVNFGLSAGAGHGGKWYVILGSRTGVEPGVPLPGGATLPLVWDSFFDYVFARLNTPVFVNFLGVLNGAGNASAQLVVPSFPASWVGNVMYYAYTVDTYNFASNPVEIEVIP